MTRCFAEASAWDGTSVRLDADETHHLAHVLRLHAGAAVEVFDGTGRVARAVIRGIEKGGAELEILETEVRLPPAASVRIIQAAIKGQRMDWLVQKLTELGASEIVIVEAERSIVRLNEGQRGKRTDRWTAIARGAAKQCGAVRVPVISVPGTLRVALKHIGEGGPCLYGALGPGSRPVRDVLGELRERNERALSVCIGPEGDFTERECEHFASSGCLPVGLGNTVLRAETAAIYAMSAIRYEFSL